MRFTSGGVPVSEIPIAVAQYGGSAAVVEVSAFSIALAQELKPVFWSVGSASFIGAVFACSPNATREWLDDTAKRLNLKDFLDVPTGTARWNRLGAARGEELVSRLDEMFTSLGVGTMEDLRYAPGERPPGIPSDYRVSCAICAFTIPLSSTERSFSVEDLRRARAVGCLTQYLKENLRHFQAPKLRPFFWPVDVECGAVWPELAWDIDRTRTAEVARRTACNPLFFEPVVTQIGGDSLLVQVDCAVPWTRPPIQQIARQEKGDSDSALLPRWIYLREGSARLVSSNSRYTTVRLPGPGQVLNFDRTADQLQKEIDLGFANARLLRDLLETEVERSTLVQETPVSEPLLTRLSTAVATRIPAARAIVAPDEGTMGLGLRR